MSNQVFLNSQTKIYDFNGLNNYIRDGPMEDLGPEVTPYEIAFNVDNIVQNDSLYTWDEHRDHIGINIEGMYSIMCSVACIADVNAGNNYLNFWINITRPGVFTDLRLAQQSQLINNTVLVTQPRVIYSQVTLYLKRGDIISFLLLVGGDQPVTVQQNNTALTISKIN
jgi:hypothetical protein